MSETLSLSTMPIADKVQRHMMASYSALQLDALQAEAKRLGYFFAQSDTAATMPPVLAERLAWATEYRRRCYLYPNCPERWEQQTDESMSDGYAQEHCRSMLAALAALGIRLQESPQAFDMLAAEECRMREKVSLPLTDKPWPKSEVKHWDDDVITPYFKHLDEASEDAQNMSTTKEIDFDPTLFGERASELTGMPSFVKAKSRRWPFFLVFLLAFVVGIAVIFIVITKLNTPPVARSTGYQFSTKGETAPPMLAIQPHAAPDGVPRMQGYLPGYSSNSHQWCDGDETICAAITTGKPAETLQKLIAAIPRGTAKQYKVRLSVTAIEETEKVTSPFIEN